MALTMAALAQHENYTPFGIDRARPPYHGEHAPSKGGGLMVQPKMDNHINATFEQYDLDNNGIDTRDELHGLTLNLSSDFRVGLTKALLADLVHESRPSPCTWPT